MEDIEFKKIDEDNIDTATSYQILDLNKKEIGYIQGFVSNRGQLICIIKIFKKEYRNKGIGFAGFKILFDELDKKKSINTIMGGWNAGGEFADYEEGMSTNLKVFNEKIRLGFIPKDAAIATPTGKWAQKLGFTNVEIRNQSKENVEVSFHRVITK